MPLSEHEQHLLEQMEQALYAEDPKFASHMVGSSAKARQRRRVIIGVVVAIVGLALVVLGVMGQKTWLGGIGFAVMVGGAGFAITPARVRKSGDQQHSGIGAVGDDGTVAKARKPGSAGRRKKGASPSKGTFMQRLEARWDRRRDEGFH